MHNPAFAAHDEMSLSRKLRVESKVFGGVLALSLFRLIFPVWLLWLWLSNSANQRLEPHRG